MFVAFVVIGIFLLAAGMLLYVYFHPQIIISRIQKALCHGSPINSFEPFYPAMKAKKRTEIIM